MHRYYNIYQFPVKEDLLDISFDEFGGITSVPPLRVNVRTLNEEDSSSKKSNSHDESTNLATIRFNEVYAQTNFIYNVWETEENQLRLLLSQWNQEHLADTLLAEKVYVSTLKIINRHHMQRLLKKFDMGTEILFEQNLEKWRESIGRPLLPSCDTSIPPCTPTLSEIIRPLTSVSATNSREGSSLNSAINTISISLREILNETPRGKMLVEFYSQFSRFQEEQRTSLISLIAHYFEEKNLKMTLSASYKMENEILEIFPSEKLEYFRTSKRGRIYNKYANLTQSFKNAVSKHIRNDEREVIKNTRHEKSFEPEANGEICLNSLKFDNLSAEEFDRTWKACSHFRLEFIKSNKSIIEVFEKWPFYKTPSGYRLIDIDFRIAFNNRNGLLSEWSQNVEKITLFLTTEQHIKDRNIKGMLAHIKNNDALSENGKYAALIWAIHGFLVPTNKVVKKDLTGKKITTKFTIKDSQESVIYLGSNQQQVEEYISHLKKTKVWQPAIYATGKDIFSIENIFVQFGETRYEFTSILSALDICFKIIFLFDLKFPEESIMFYTFIESYFYKFKPSHNYAKVHILSEFLST
ncbi:unnamed protein product [Ceutorhynchus assimilis]|uniref:Uncharacterized protein n=1 Tax=Ceutorhynchus assimilis TaxID=467358 RepID=A0A9P0DCX4_9CUCU|nr:unnamed protein product [Ceutorhynchus assimilis]